ncbi:MAG: M48 family metalloprotease, partial [Xanthobacteraceae bacterium]
MRRGQFELISCRLGRAVALFAALLLAACTASSSAYAPQGTASLPAKTAEAPMAPDILREHQRILAAYGGIYNEPRLQTLIERTVERLVAASERPDLHYKITVLNSQSVNAFALPSGQLYV